MELCRRALHPIPHKSSRCEKMTSPDSFIAPSRESTNTTFFASLHRRVRASPAGMRRWRSHDSRVSASLPSAPAFLNWSQSRLHRRRRTASSADIAVAPISCANRFACSSVGLQTRISSNCLTSRRASTWLRACTPLPRMARTLASGDASSFVAAADTAAVLISVINRPSIIASGVPVCGSTRKIVAMCVGIPRSAFDG